jgi:hypothetical protein
VLGVKRIVVIFSLILSVIVATFSTVPQASFAGENDFVFPVTSRDGITSTVSIYLPPSSDPGSVTIELASDDLTTSFLGAQILIKPVVKRYGVVVKRYTQSLIVTMPASKVDLIPFYSSDGKTWTEIAQSDSIEILSASDLGYLRDAKGATMIYTKIAGYLRMTAKSPLTVSPSPTPSPTATVSPTPTLSPSPTSSASATVSPSPTVTVTPTPAPTPAISSIAALIPSTYLLHSTSKVSSRDGISASIQIYLPATIDLGSTSVEFSNDDLSTGFLGELVIVKPIVLRFGTQLGRYSQSLILTLPKSKLDLVPLFSTSGKSWQEIPESSSLDILSALDVGYSKDIQGATIIYSKIAGYIRMVNRADVTSVVSSTVTPTPKSTPTPSQIPSVTPSPTPKPSVSPTSTTTPSPSATPSASSQGGDVLFPIVSVLNGVSQMPSIAYYQSPRVVKVDLAKLKSVNVTAKEPITLEVSKLKPNLLVAPIFVGATGSSIFLPSVKSSKKGILKLEPFVITTKGTYRVIIRTADETVMKLITLVVK